MFTDGKRASDFWSVSFLVTYSLVFCLFVSSFHEVYFMIYFLTMEKQIGNLQYETSHVLEASAIYTCESHVLFFSELHSQWPHLRGLRSTVVEWHALQLSLATPPVISAPSWSYLIPYTGSGPTDRLGKGPWILTASLWGNVN